MTWFNIIKMVYPNHMTNRRGRSGRRQIKGSGTGGLFRYHELSNIDPAVTPLVDAAYDKEIEKLVEKHTKIAEKKKKQAGEEITNSMRNFIRKRVTDELQKQKEKNLYATYYGSHQKKGFGGKGKWFHGRVPALGVNPDDKQRVSALLRTVHGAAKYAGSGWDKPKKKEIGDEEE